MKNETDEILLALDDKEPEHKPVNHLWMALIFSDIIFFMLDAISGIGVYWLLGLWYYGFLVFMAGFVPLLMYQKLYTRPYASTTQKKAAMLGVGLSMLSVLAIAVALGVIRFVVSDVAWVEAGLIVSLVLLAFTHAIISGYYYYTDEEVLESQKTTRIIARGQRNIQRIGIAHKVANAKTQEVKYRKNFEDRFSPEVLAKIQKMLQDSDNDGIPDIIDPVDNRKFQTRVFAKDSQQAEIDPKEDGD